MSQVQGHQDIDDPGDGGEQPEEEAEEDQRLRLSGCHVRLGHVPTGERSPGLAQGGEREGLEETRSTRRGFEAAR